MKNTMKKTLILILAVIIFWPVVPTICVFGINYQAGDIIEFGSYPQSEVKDEALIAELNAISPEWEDWTSYGYYRGNENEIAYYGIYYNDDYSTIKENYWKYIDVSLEGVKYRGVRFLKYRPYHTHYFPNNSNSLQKENGYFISEIYWFKYEPISWIVLNPDTGLLICETILDSQPFSNTVYKAEVINPKFYNDNEFKNFANNYETSSIRQWLNNDFYNVAFSEEEKGIVETVTLNNCSYETLTGMSGYEILDGNETDDNVFLLSYNEVIDSNNGFDSNYEADDILRQSKGSDYAKCQGLAVNTNSEDKYEDNSFWLLRTGCVTFYCSTIGYDGTVGTGTSVNTTTVGIRPALIIHTHIPTEIPTIAATCTTSGSTASIKCLKCGEILKESEVIPASGHTAKWSIVKNPTCTEMGKKAGFCTECKQAVVETIEKTNHNNIEWIEVKSPTCSSAGVAESVCSVCNQKQIKTIDRLPHTEIVIQGTPAECTSSGISDGKECTACGQVTLIQEMLSPLGHNLILDTTKSTFATCSTKGMEYFTCSRCNYSENREVDCLEHSWYKWMLVNEASCDTQGLKIRKCLLCNAEEEKNFDSLGGHEVEVFSGYEPTCTDSGKTSGSQCPKCNTIFEEQLEIPAYGHKWKEPIEIASTCSEVGFWATECQICECVWEKELPVTGHLDGNSDYICDYNCGYEFEKPTPEKPDTPDEPVVPDTPVEPEEELSFFEKIVEWFKNIFEKLFGWLKF